MSKSVNMSPAELLQKLRAHETPLLLDVRDPAEFQSWHIPGSKNISAASLSEKTSKLPKDKEIIVICSRGISSKNAADTLSKLGFNSKILEEGLKGWNATYDAVQVQPFAQSSVEVFQIKRLGKGCLSYVVVLNDKGSAIIIDPAQHIQYYIDYLSEHNLKLLATADTHVHADHVSGARALAEQMSVPYFLPKKSTVSFPFHPLENEFEEIVGEKVKIIETPGHTKEGVCVMLGNSFIFTGDTLFIESVGRSDLRQNIRDNAKLLFLSVTEKIFTLDDSLLVLPAHNQEPMLPGEPPCVATLGDIKKTNEINKFATAEEFAGFTDEHPSPTPPNYTKIKEINLGREPGSEDFDELELGGNRCAIS